MTLTCPVCKETCELDVEVVEGQHILCPFCGQKFPYSQGESSVATQKLQRPCLGSVNLLMVPELHHRFDFAYLLSSSFCPGKWSVAACDKCGHVDVFFQRWGNSGSLVLTCECGNEFDMDSARQVFKERFLAMLSTANRYRKVQDLRERFMKQMQVFEEDWNFHHDPKTPVRLRRLREDNERLYKRLEVENANRMIHAQHRTSHTILGYANTMDDGFARGVVELIGQIGEAKSRAAENEALSSAESIARQIEKREAVIDYCNDLEEEFAGCGDHKAAMSQRLIARVGVDEVSKIPPGLPLVELQKLEDGISDLEGYLMRTMRSLRRGVEYMRSAAMALVVFCIVVCVADVPMACAAFLASILSLIVFVICKSILSGRTKKCIAKVIADCEC